MAFRISRLRAVASQTTGVCRLCRPFPMVPTTASAAAGLRAIRLQWSWSPTRATTIRSRCAPQSARPARPRSRSTSCWPTGLRGWPIVS